MKRLVLQHRIDGPMRGWICNTAKKNLWRVYEWYNLEDLIQDGFICYAKCNVKYRHIRNVRHFMALVKVTYTNHIHKLASKKTIRKEAVLPSNDPVFDQPMPEESTFHTMLGQLPVELQRLILILLNDASKIPRLKYRDGTWETTNQYLCRLVALDSTLVDVKFILKEHFYS